MTKQDTDRARLYAALSIIKSHFHNATHARLETSDQGHYGFVLVGVSGPGGEIEFRSDELPGDAEDRIQELLCDLDWNSVVGEDRSGYATVALPDEPAMPDSPNAIYRTVFTIEVFTRGPLDMTLVSDTDVSDLAAIDALITDGGGIGEVRQTEQLMVPPDQVEASLLRIGNDGTFFEWN